MRPRRVGREPSREAVKAAIDKVEDAYFKSGFHPLNSTEYADAVVEAEASHRALRGMYRNPAPPVTLHFLLTIARSPRSPTY